jgi:2-polyprenyl-6-methoxyphenol hydroxylase-like FAD-dependent oxidoreductase
MLQQRSQIPPGSHFDAIVVGARCAGSPLATMLARAGLKVCLVDRASFPSDTPSTHGILPPGVKVLDRLGVLDRVLEVAPAVDRGILAFDELRVEMNGITALTGAPTVNVRRITLDAILLEAAAAAGVEIRTGTSVTGLVERSGSVAGVETTAGVLRAPLVVGADGANSAVARFAGAREYHRTAPRRLFLWAYYEGVDEAERRLWLGNIGGDGYLASASDAGLFLAAFVAPIDRRGQLRGDRETAYDEGISRWPELAAQLGQARRVGPVRMMSRWHGFFRESAGPGWALVGDAGHFKDPTPGQGISDALRQGEAMVPAIVRTLDGAAPGEEPLRGWWAWRDRDAREMYWFAQDMGDTERAPLLVRAMQARFVAEPRLVDEMLRVLAHDLPPSQLFTPSLVSSILAKALRTEPGRRLALIAEAGRLAAEEVRRSARHLSDIPRHRRRFGRVS